jgi:hypothetical protein
MGAPTTGWPEVGLTPTSRSTCACSTSSNDPLAPESPTERRSANDVGAWHTRAQLSMLCVPIAARKTRCIA